MSHSTTRRRGSRSGARRARRERVTAGAPRLAQRAAQVRRRPRGRLLRPARPAQRHRQRELAHEPGQHEQLGRGQLGEVRAGQPLRWRCPDTGRSAARRRRQPPASILAGRRHPLISRTAWAWAARAASRRTSRLWRPALLRGAPGRAWAGRAGWRHVGQATEHRVEDAPQRVDVLLARHQGGQRAQVQPGRGDRLGHGDGPANRSQRPRSAGTPAAAAPPRTARRPGPDRRRRPPGPHHPAPARSPAPPGSGSAGPASRLIGSGHGREPGGPDGLQVLGVLEHRAGGLARGRAVEAGRRRARSAPRPS